MATDEDTKNGEQHRNLPSENQIPGVAEKSKKGLPGILAGLLYGFGIVVLFIILLIVITIALTMFYGMLLFIFDPDFMADFMD